MSARVDARTIERIKDRTPIESVIGTDVRLVRQGRHLVGLCPFHKEKTPSFSVDPVQRVYLCRGCGAHGDVFSYLRDAKGTPFSAALVELANHSGLRLEDNAIAPKVRTDWPDGAARECWEKLAGVKWNPARAWLDTQRGIPVDIELASGVATMDQQGKLLRAWPECPAGVWPDGRPRTAREWVGWHSGKQSHHSLVAPWRNASTNLVEGLSLRTLSPFGARIPHSKSYAPGLAKCDAHGTPRGYGFAGASLKAPILVLCEGLVDTLVMEAILRGHPDIVCAGALDSGEMKTSWTEHLRRRQHGRVVVIPHLDEDKPDRNGVMQMGPGPAAAVAVLARVPSAVVLDTSPITAALPAGRPHPLADMGDIAHAWATAQLPFVLLRSLTLDAITRAIG